MRSHDAKGAGARAAPTQILPMPTPGKRSLTEQLPGSGPVSAGSPLPAAVRAKMERAFGADFSQVRVRESDHARALGAIAFTQGDDITFAPGTYDPDSAAGQRLLGHELTHVVQQRGGRVATPTTGKVQTDGGLEAEADALGDRAAAGAHAAAAAGGASSAPRDAPIQRKVLLDGSIDDPALGTPAKLYAERDGCDVETLEDADLSTLKVNEPLSIFGHGSEGSHDAPPILARLNDPERGLPSTWRGTLYLGYCHAGNDLGDGKEGANRSLVSAVAAGLVRGGIAIEGARGQAVSQYGGDELSKVVAERVIRREVALLFSEPSGLPKDKEKRNKELRRYYESVTEDMLPEKVRTPFLPRFLELMLAEEERPFREVCNAAIKLCEEFDLVFPEGKGMQTEKSTGFSSDNWGTRSKADRRDALASLPDAGLRSFAREIGGEMLELAVGKETARLKGEMLDLLEKLQLGVALVPSACVDAKEDLARAETGIKDATTLLSEDAWNVAKTSEAISAANNGMYGALGTFRGWDPEEEVEQEQRKAVSSKVEVLYDELNPALDLQRLWRTAVIDCIATHE